MTDPTPRPQPVLAAARIGGYVQAALAAIGGVVVIFYPAVTGDQVSKLSVAVGIAVTALVSLGVYVGAIIHGKAAAAKVTPLESPQDNQGRALVPAEEYGRHAATVGDPLDDWPAAIRSEPETPAKTGEPTRHIPEQVIPGRRLGRHINHDPRSLSYLVPETTVPATAMWARRVPVFDQGNLGSCTGNAAAGVLGTSPFYETLPAGLVDDEAEAVKLYSAATSLDSYPGSYPPDDTGSDGLSVAKTCKAAGLISGYQHITSVAAAQTAIKGGPFIVGCNWYSSMDNPTAEGLVKVSGTIRGGHEFECHGYDAAADLWWFTNSWGPSWGKDGTFCMSSASFARLLSEQGDATVFLPVVPVPAPQPPVPVPTPVPGPVPPLPASALTWARRAVKQLWRSKDDRQVAQEILDVMGAGQ